MCNCNIFTHARAVPKTSQCHRSEDGDDGAQRQVCSLLSSAERHDRKKLPYPSHRRAPKAWLGLRLIFFPFSLKHFSSRV